jgi:uncharacterized protein (UPF0548 family)
VTYPEVGATRGVALPGGYDLARRRIRLGSGPAVFAEAATRLREWVAHRGAGLRLYPDSPAQQAGATVLLRPAFGPALVAVPCRVVWTVDEPRRAGFGYGTLPGHPQRGEEAFVVERDAEDAVWFTIVAFSRPASWYARLGGPLTRLVQWWMLGRYLRALA